MGKDKGWKDDGAGESKTEKTKETPDGGSRYDSLRTNEGSKSDHQHTYIKYDSDGNITGGGATPGKK